MGSEQAVYGLPSDPHPIRAAYARQGAVVWSSSAQQVDSFFTLTMAAPLPGSFMIVLDNGEAENHYASTGLLASVSQTNYRYIPLAKIPIPLVYNATPVYGKSELWIGRPIAKASPGGTTVSMVHRHGWGNFHALEIVGMSQGIMLDMAWTAVNHSAPLSISVTSPVASEDCVAIGTYNIDSGASGNKGTLAGVGTTWQYVSSGANTVVAIGLVREGATVTMSASGINGGTNATSVMGIVLVK